MYWDGRINSSLLITLNTLNEISILFKKYSKSRRINNKKNRLLFPYKCVCNKTELPLFLYVLRYKCFTCNLIALFLTVSINKKSTKIFCNDTNFGPVSVWPNNTNVNIYCLLLSKTKFNLNAFFSFHRWDCWFSCLNGLLLCVTYNGLLLESVT